MTTLSLHLNPFRCWCLRTLAVGLLAMAGLGAVEPLVTPAEPGPAVPALEPLGAALTEVKAGGTVTLTVKAVAGAPVQFIAKDGGHFANGAGVHTVTANADGIATAAYTATPDAVQIVNLSIASPRCSGRLAQTLRVLP